MDPTTRRDTPEAADQVGRGYARHDAPARRDREVREYQPPSVNEQTVRKVTAEEMAAHSPEGRVPDPRSRGRGRTVLWVFLAVGLTLVLGTVIYLGGMPALLMGLVYVCVFAAVAFPVWYAGLMRKREEEDADHIVRTTLGEQQEGHQPPGPAV